MIILLHDSSNESDLARKKKIEKLAEEYRFQSLYLDILQDAGQASYFDITKSEIEFKQIIRAQKRNKILNPDPWNPKDVYCFVQECQFCFSILKYDFHSIEEQSPGNTFIKCPACNFSLRHEGNENVSKNRFKKIWVYEHPKANEHFFDPIDRFIYRYDYNPNELVLFSQGFENFKEFVRYPFVERHVKCTNKHERKHRVSVFSMSLLESGFEMCSCFYDTIMPTERMVML